MENAKSFAIFIVKQYIIFIFQVDNYIIIE